ncbi:MAG TPA: malto-oligosyltrehalose trehalohydrolase [Terracidiphilus sp.]|nr:malto-oligosyltrehalose trehalohydrolase [Terracidiphilus sp.]
MPFFGANWNEKRTSFRVWAPKAESVQLILDNDQPHTLPMQPEANGCFGLEVEGIQSGTLYRYQMAGHDPWPDPASRFQPQGVHGPSQVVNPCAFSWSDADWTGINRENLVLYELHVGTFTPEGTFTAATQKLPYLRNLGVTAIELMPIADFPGSRNWGYDGVSLYAPAHCYGTPDELRTLIDTAHRLGLAVHLDVVYNHLGPDGAYIAAYSSQVFSRRHRSPWGAGLNFDSVGSHALRRFFIDNAMHWVHEYHADGLRLDATHAIVDDSPRHFLDELAETIQSSLMSEKRNVLLIAEDERNLARIAMPHSEGGYGLDAIWADDLHHEIHCCLTGQHDGYFEDFSGSAPDIATTASQGWFYCGQLAKHSGINRGTDPTSLPYSSFVICLQNHDQVGNRAMGERLNHLVDLPSYRAASVLLLMSPETPLLFMGQEWAASSPFLYFTDHGPELGRKVTEGRRREFARFASFSDPAARKRIPDPQAETTFTQSHLNWSEPEEAQHQGVLHLYQTLLHLRTSHPAMQTTLRTGFDIVPLGDNALLLRRQSGQSALLALIQLRGAQQHNLRQHQLAQLSPERTWQPVLTTEDSAFTPDALIVDFSPGLLHIGFSRPGAIILDAATTAGNGGEGA